MYSIGPSSVIEESIQEVYWAILIIFFILAISSWLIASKGWFNEEQIRDENAKEQAGEHPES